MITTLNIDEVESNAQQYYAKQANWQFSQLFGESATSDDSNDSIEEMDNLISALSFDDTGKFLAVGYTNGQVVILSENEDKTTYKLHAEFKSHDSAFDCLTSVEIEERINMIKWYPFNSNQTQHLLTTNEKTVKLFKIMELPYDDGESVVVRPRKIYDGAHAYNINSISFNTDGETFISVDDLRINLWNIECDHETFGIVDIKPENIDELNEVITCGTFHNRDCNLLAYGSSRGIVRFADLRTSSSCTSYAREFEDVNSDIGGFFHEVVSTISDIKFSPDGQFIASRDYLTMKIWDSRKEKEPLRVIKFHNHLVPRLCDLYENDCIFDKFECAWSGDSMRLITGSYSNNFFICDAFGSGITHVQAIRPGSSGESKQLSNNRDYSSKVLHSAWHPKQDIIVTGAKDFGFLYINSNQ